MSGGLRTRQRAASAKVPRGLRCDRTADAIGVPCPVKFPPKDPASRNDLPPQQDDGGFRVTCGRIPNLYYSPTSFQAHLATARPLDQSLRRDYVFGYDGGCMHSMHFVSDEECVYPVARLCIVANFVTNAQRYFEGHTSRVTCVAFNNHRRLCASGQTDERGSSGPKVLIWTPDDCSRTLSTLPHPEYARWITAVGFSSDGHTCVSFCADDAFSYFIWRNLALGDRKGQPETLRPFYSASSGRQGIGAVFGCPNKDPRIVNFHTVGIPAVGNRGLTGHFAFWSLQMPAKTENAEPIVSHKRGIFGKNAMPKNCCGVCSPAQGSSLMVADNGFIYVLHSNTATRCRRIAAGATTVALGCVVALPDGRWLAGGSDGALYLGRAEPAPELEERLVLGEGLRGKEAEQLSSTSTPQFASLAVRGNLVLAGTLENELMLIDLPAREVLRVLQVAHCGNAWALDFHPSLAILATGSHTKGVRFWNAAERRPAVGKVLRTVSGVSSVAFGGADGQMLAVGCTEGSLEVYSFPSLAPAYRQSISRAGEQIGDVRFSPRGTFLAAACSDQFIYLLWVSEADGSLNVGMACVLSGNSSAPTCVMFSADSEFVMSNSKDMQILYWRTKDGARQKTMSSFRDVAWQQPWTCVLGWPVIGMWADEDYGATNIKSCCQASPPHQSYIAMGDDNAKVKLLRYPSPFLNPPCQVVTGHASMITKVRFSKDNVLATLGGDDRAICLWSLVPTADQVRIPDRVTHPWRGLVDEGEDPYSFLGQPAPAQNRDAGARSQPAPSPAQRFGDLGNRTAGGYVAVAARPPAAPLPRDRGASTGGEVPRRRAGDDGADFDATGGDPFDGWPRALGATMPASGSARAAAEGLRGGGDRTGGPRARSQTPGGHRGSFSHGNASLGVGAALRWDG